VVATDKPARAHWQAVAFSGLLVFDLTVFVLTMARSITLWTRKEPFLHRLFLDGLLYYGVIWNLNLVNIVVLLTVNPAINLSTPVFTNVLSVVMISRIMISLRDPKLHKPVDCDETVTTSDAGYISTVMLDDILSTMMATQFESSRSRVAA